MGRMSARVLGPLVACAAVLLAPSVAAAAPTGSVTGWRSPAAGSMTLTVSANPDGVALRSATATLGGVTFPVGDFKNRGGCPGLCPAEALVKIDTTQVPNGLHELVVTILDVDGQTHPLRSSPEPLMLEVDNTVRESPCKVDEYTCELSVQIGSGNITPQPSPGDGGVAGEGASTCASPQLSMRLASKPLRYRRGVPVLAAGRSYRYAGHLTCRINGRRKAAPRGTEVQVRNRLRGWTISKPSIKLRKAGDVVANLAYRSSRVVIFRVRATGGDVVRVRIPIRVVHVGKGRR